MWHDIVAQVNSTDPVLISSGDRLFYKIITIGICLAFLAAATVVVQLFPNKTRNISIILVVVGVAALVLASLITWELVPIERGGPLSFVCLFGGFGTLYAGVKIYKSQRN